MVRPLNGQNYLEFEWLVSQTGLRSYIIKAPTHPRFFGDKSCWDFYVRSFFAVVLLLSRLFFPAVLVIGRLLLYVNVVFFICVVLLAIFMPFFMVLLSTAKGSEEAARETRMPVAHT